MSIQRSLEPVDLSVSMYAAAGSTTASVIYDDKLFLFYNGSNNDGHYGIYFTTYDGVKWFTQKHNVRETAPFMSVAINTGPCAVVFKDKIYLFFNGVGNDGTWFVNFVDGALRPEVLSVRDKMHKPMKFLPKTSPSAAVYHSMLFLFWNGSSNNDDYNIYYTVFDGDKTWSPPRNINDLMGGGCGIAGDTSPAAITFNDELYLFYNGKGNDGTWYIKFLSPTKAERPRSLKTILKNQSFEAGTSPSVGIWYDRLCLFWDATHTHSDDGISYCLFNTSSGWSNERKIARSFTRTTPSFVLYHHIPFVFMPREPDGYLMYTKGLVCDLAVKDINEIISHIGNRAEFSLYTTDSKSYSVFKSKFPQAWAVPNQNYTVLFDRFGGSGRASLELPKPVATAFTAILFAQLKGTYNISIQIDDTFQLCLLHFIIPF